MRITRISSSQLGVIFDVIHPTSNSIGKRTEHDGKGTYIKLAACNILTTFDITSNLSAGTLSQRLKASMSFPRISFPGLELMYLNGSRIAWIVSVPEEGHLCISHLFVLI